MDAVASSFSASQNYYVIWCSVFPELLQWQKPYASAVYNDVSCVAFVKVYCPIHRGDSHVVAVTAYPSHYAHVNILWMLHTRWKFLIVKIQWAETENVSACNRISPNSEDIADYSADSCGCSAKRLYCRRGIMCLNFGSYSVAFVELDYACVVFAN